MALFNDFLWVNLNLRENLRGQKCIDFFEKKPMPGFTGVNPEFGNILIVSQLHKVKK